ncbi:hypothetical protein BV22DRAFT_79751 [Leucogyrophana mollusca]|uniref:Uncharacterized protein n=1 Tax=Leucogyrophana mollusca TaxID=85980 RepID=A0ACB8BZN7_9AGAM|nr:hypothetical protein BV22DRAFT_79751 [Leucogyrophana mollusca]
MLDPGCATCTSRRPLLLPGRNQALSLKHVSVRARPRRPTLVTHLTRAFLIYYPVVFLALAFPYKSFNTVFNCYLHLWRKWNLRLIPPYISKLVQKRTTWTQLSVFTRHTPDSRCSKLQCTFQVRNGIMGYQTDLATDQNDQVLFPLLRTRRQELKKAVVAHLFKTISSELTQFRGCRSCMEV